MNKCSIHLRKRLCSNCTKGGNRVPILGCFISMVAISSTVPSMLMVMLLVAVSESQNCPSTQYCEFELLLVQQQLASWPGAGVTNAQFLQSLSTVTNTANTLANMTRVFDTVVIGSWSPSGSPNASAIALDVVTAITAAVAGTGSTSAQSFTSTYKVTGAQYGYQPIIVPSYLRVPSEPDQTIFAILGGIAACFVVAQVAYGLYHFKGIGFLIGTANERD